MSGANVVDELTDDVEALAEKAASYIDLAQRGYHDEIDDELRRGDP